MRTAKRTTTPKIVRQYFDYDANTGHFTWKERRDAMDRLNVRVLGKRAGSYMGNGYRYLWVDGVKYYEHRIAWLWVHGEWPVADEEIDHINGIKDDNRIVNLRIASRSQNEACKFRQNNSASGFVGVRQDKSNRTNPWTARIGVNGTTLHLGSFPTKEMAAVAYSRAARKHFGEFARVA